MGGPGATTADECSFEHVIPSPITSQGYLLNSSASEGVGIGGNVGDDDVHLVESLAECVACAFSFRDIDSVRSNPLTGMEDAGGGGGNGGVGGC